MKASAWEQETQHLQLQLHAKTLTQALTRSLHGYLEALYAIESFFAGSQEVTREGIALALIDATAPVGERLLYRSGGEGGGDADPPAADTPEARHPGLSWATTIELAGRRWEIHVTPTPAYLAAHRPWQAWGVLAGGLLFAGLLGGFLLLVTGRTAQVEAVNQHLGLEVAERMRAEAALRQSEAHYRTLFDHHPHPLWVYDLDTLAFLVVNDATIAHYGYSREEFMAMTIRDIRPPDDLPALAENLSTLPPGLDTPDHWRHQRKDGSISGKMAASLMWKSPHIAYGLRGARRGWC